MCEELKMREPPPARPFDVAQGERPLTGMDSRLWRTYSPIGVGNDGGGQGGGGFGRCGLGLIPAGGRPAGRPYRDPPLRRGWIPDQSRE